MTPKLIDQFRGAYAFLSNYYMSHPFYYNGWYCKSGEHGYQASKAAHNKERDQILQAPTPGKAKRLGRICTLIDEWDQGYSIGVMVKIVRAKFQDAIMRENLLSTGDALLVEGNVWHDNFWGRCQCPKCKGIDGLNMLGNILMFERTLITLDDSDLMYIATELIEE